MRQNQWSFLKKADFFGQDHLPVFNYIIGNNIYTLFEDAPYCFKFALPRLRKPSRNILSRLLSGKHKQRLFGNNDKCNEIIITENEIQPYMKDKKINTVFLSSLWENSSMLKRQLIMDIFDVTPQDIELIKSKENILLTQCFVEDNIITPEERCRIYRKIVDNYDRSTLLIKKHPREIFDYKTLFPDILVFEKTTPMHLLTLLGIRFKKAITVFSSSVASFDYDIEIDWYGTEISKVLVDGFGVIKCPPLYTTKESNSTIVK
jgi:hypothetical protein